MPHRLAVINTQGEVWAREVTESTISAGVKLSGPGLFGGPDDKYVIGLRENIAVITKTGDVWNRKVTATTVENGSNVGNIFGGPNDKYVLSAQRGYAGIPGGLILVVNTDGEVWQHNIDKNILSSRGKLNGPGLFGGPNDKYVVYEDSAERILVINTNGEVWAHNLLRKDSFSPIDGIGGGYKLDGPGLFGGPNDKYVVYLYGQLLVINAQGEVWARKVLKSTVTAGVKLSGPGLFGEPNDKYVIGYHLADPPPHLADPLPR
jgi:hypothetical protein